MPDLLYENREISGFLDVRFWSNLAKSTIPIHFSPVCVHASNTPKTNLVALPCPNSPVFNQKQLAQGYPFMNYATPIRGPCILLVFRSYSFLPSSRLWIPKYTPRALPKRVLDLGNNQSFQWSLNGVE
jgi:hypothetical protein